jgi:hypothetical protein
MATITGLWEPFVFASDLHGDHLHRPTVKRLLDFMGNFKPKITIFGGDVFNLAALRKGAGPEDRACSIKGDMTEGFQFLEDYFKTGDRKHILWGNHDLKRLYHLRDTSNQDGLIHQLALDAITDIDSRVKKLGAKQLPYDKRHGILFVGQAGFAHGYYIGVNAARQHALTYGSIHFGHTHTIDVAPVPGLERRVARGVGCLCDLSMDYNSAQPGTLRQAHGFAYGAIHRKTGKFFSNQAEEIDGTWNIDVL